MANPANPANNALNPLSSTTQSGDPASSSSSTSSSNTQDVLETSTSTPPPISLKQYIASVTGPTLASQLQQYADQQSQSQSKQRVDTYTGSDMGTFYQVVEQIVSMDDSSWDLENLATNVNTDVLNSFNPTQTAEDQNQIDMLNTAINNYNTAAANYTTADGNYTSALTTYNNLVSEGSPQPDTDNALAALNTAYANLQTATTDYTAAATAYNSAADTYQTYADSRNPSLTQYNTDADAYNSSLPTLVPQINTIREELGLTTSSFDTIPDLASMQAPNQVPTTPPPPSNLPQPVSIDEPSAVNTTSLIFGDSLFPPYPDSGSYLSSYTNNFFTTLKNLLTNQTDSGNFAKLIQELYNPNYQIPGLPPAYLQKNPSINLPASFSKTPSLGNTISAYVFPTALSDPTLAGNITQALANLDVGTDFNLFPSKAANQTVLLARNQVGFASSAAVVPALNALDQTSPQGGVNAANYRQALVAIYTAQNIINDLNNNTLKAPIAAIVNNNFANSNLSEDQLNKIADALLTTTKNGLIKTALNLVAAGLNLNNLTPAVYSQVLAGLNVPPALNTVITSPNNTNANAVLANPATPALLQPILQNSAASLGIPQTQAAPAITSALSAVINNAPYNGLAEVKNSAYQNFRQNFSQPASLLLANNVAQFIQQANTAPNANSPFTPNNNALNNLQTALQASNAAQATAINTALTATLATAPQTFGAFQNNFITALQATGLNFAAAQNLAQTTATILNTQTQAATFNVQNVNGEVLQASVAHNLANAALLITPITQSPTGVPVPVLTTAAPVTPTPIAAPTVSPVTPAPAAAPTITPVTPAALPTAAPVAPTVAPVTPTPVAPPTVTPAPVAPPTVTPAPVAAPTVTPAPVAAPTVTPTPVAPPTVTPATAALPTAAPVTPTPAPIVAPAVPSPPPAAPVAPTAQQIAFAAVNITLNTTPAPTTPEALKYTLSQALQQQGIPLNLANIAAANAFITTQAVPATQNPGLVKEQIKNEISASLVQLSGRQNDNLSNQIADLLFNENGSSISSQLSENIRELNAGFPNAESLAPPVTQAIYADIQDANNKHETVLNSINSATLIADGISAIPAWGIPRRIIDAPQIYQG